MQTKKTTTKEVTKSTLAKKVAKKVVKKAPAKKATKKTVVKKQTKKQLVYAPDHQSFWVTNGEILNSLVALKDALAAMEQEVYSYHAGEAHNDFARWVADVLADGACAVELEKAETPTKAKTVVLKHLKSYHL